MDPDAIVASIGSLCGTTVKLISTVSEFIDAAQQAPVEVQSLANEMASLYSSLGHIKIAVQAARVSEIPDQWEEDFNKLNQDCCDTLEIVQYIVDKAKKTETTGSAKQMLKTVKFVFKAKQVDLLRRRIVSQDGILQILLSALAETRGAYIEKRLKDIHGKVEELVSSMAKIRQVLVVLQSEDEKESEAHHVLSDRTSRQQPSSSTPLKQKQKASIEEYMEVSQSWQAERHPVVESTMNHVLAKLTALTESVDKIEKRNRIGEDDIIKQIVAATRPSADVQKAINLISTKVWSLERYRHRSTSSGAWTEIRPIDYKCTQFRLKFLLDESGKLSKNILSNTGEFRFGGTGCWKDGRFQVEGRIVTDAPPLYNSASSTWTYEEWTLPTIEDARELKSCLVSIVRLSHLVRKLRVVAGSHFNPNLNVANPTELDVAAYKYGS